MHNHVIAGDFGYLPTYSSESGYAAKSEAIDGLKEYVNEVVDSTEGPESPDQFKTLEEFWLATTVVEDIGTDGCKDIIQVVFDRAQASIDYVEITECHAYLDDNDDCLGLDGWVLE